MNYKNEILKLLKEEEETTFSSSVDDLGDTTDAIKDIANSDSTLKPVIQVTKEGEELEEGIDNLEVPDDVEASEGEYLEREKLKNDVATSMGEGVGWYKISPLQVIGRMSRGKLEKLVEQNKNLGKAHKKIIKISELRRKNG